MEVLSLNSGREELQPFIVDTLNLYIVPFLAIYPGYINVMCYGTCATPSYCLLEALYQCEILLILKSRSYFSGMNGATAHKKSYSEGWWLNWGLQDFFFSFSSLREQLQSRKYLQAGTKLN